MSESMPPPSEGSPAMGDGAQPEAASLFGGDTPLDLFLDVRVQVSVELGRRRMTLGELLALGRGSVVELDKLAGEPLDLRVNGRLVARGEAVLVNDRFGVRLTEVVAARPSGSAPGGRA